MSVELTDEQLTRAFEHTAPGIKISWNDVAITIKSPGTTRGVTLEIPFTDTYPTPRAWLLPSLLEAVIYDQSKVIKVTSEHAASCQCSGCLFWWAALPWEEENSHQSPSAPFSTAILEDEKKLIIERQTAYNLWTTSDIYLKSRKDLPQNGTLAPSNIP